MSVFLPLTFAINDLYTLENQINTMNDNATEVDADYLTKVNTIYENFKVGVKMISVEVKKTPDPVFLEKKYASRISEIQNKIKAAFEKGLKPGAANQRGTFTGSYTRYVANRRYKKLQKLESENSPSEMAKPFRTSYRFVGNQKIKVNEVQERTASKRSPGFQDTTPIVGGIGSIFSILSGL